MNRFPLWKNILLLIILILGILYSIPNIFGEDPAVQILPNTGVTLPTQLPTTLKNLFQEKNIDYKKIESDNDSLLIRFHDPNMQIKAKDLIKSVLQEEAIVALNLAPMTPKWLEFIGAKPMKLGLDLRGGVHFLLDVDVESAFQRRLESYVSDVKADLRDNKIRWQDFEVHAKNYAFVLRFQDQETADEAYKLMRQNHQGLELTKSDDDNTTQIQATLAASLQQEISNYTVDQTISTLRNRVNELGVAEAVVQRQGLHHVVVELPGIQDTARAKDILGKTATLEFHMVNTEHDMREAIKGRTPPGNKIYYDKDKKPFLLNKRVLLTGESITGAVVGTDAQGMPAVSIRVGGGGLNLFKKATRENIGKPMATVYLETKVD
ncbi:MAG TPA: protein translocase subunit SecD, partial [Gammaproteobacteria bacterium]|nr:protein translocase subunit SecD [Gammaproteobacteria bacterium]